MKILTKGNHYDRSVLWRNQLQNKAREIINKYHIHNVIASGAPFHLLYYTALLKDHFPELNLIVDIRDPWTDNKSFWNFGQLSSSRKKMEETLELKALEKADYVITVSETMTNNLKKKIPHQTQKFISLNNGFDKEDFTFQSTNVRGKNDNNKIKFIFSGTLYDKIDTVFYPFVQMLNDLKIQNNSLYNNLTFDFYGNAPEHYKNWVSQKNVEILNFHALLPLQEIYTKIQNSDFCMLFLNDDLTFSMSTKFLEYLYLKKKIIVFSKEGSMPDFVKKNNLGFHVNPKNTEVDFMQAINYCQNNFKELETTLEIEEFSVEALSKKIETLFI